MKALLPLVIAISLILPSGCGKKEKPVKAPVDRISCTLSWDFETGELSGWESYPYAQDIGYDPMTQRQSEPARNGSSCAIARIVKPTDALDLSEGFTRRLDIWTTGDTHVQFALFLMSDRSPETLEVSLGLFDGRRYVYTIESPVANRWEDYNIPVRKFTLGDGGSLDKGEHVQAVTIKAFYPLVSHLMSYTILMDDFKLNGERQRRFITKEPESTTLEEFGISFLNHHYFYGDTIGLSAYAEDRPGLVKVVCDILDPEGKPAASSVPLYDNGSHGDTATADGLWTNEALYVITDRDARGQWTLNLTGTDQQGGEVRWGFRFLMPGARLTADNHPRLYFSADELADRMAHEESPTAKNILRNALGGKANFADIKLDNIREGENLPEESLSGGPYSRWEYDYDRWRGPMSRLQGIITSGAWRFAFTGDKEAGLKAKEALLKLCSFKVWNNPWMEAHGHHTYYPVGYVAKSVAIGYDFLFPLMSDEERKAVRDALTDKAFRHAWRDAVVNTMPSNLSNHLAVTYSGIGLAAAAVYGDDPANPYLEPYLTGILTKLRVFMDRTYFPGGSYGEPYTYQEMATRDLVETLFAFERNFGIDYTTTTNMKEFYVYPLYATHSSGRYQDFGDVSHTYSMTGPPFLWLSYRLNDPWTYAYVKPYLDSGRGGYLGYLWYTDGIKPRMRNELPTSKFFEGKGNMVMRSDWKDTGSIMIFKCGPNSNHYHLDQGTFVLMTNGEELLSDAGHGSDYYANLYYPCYYTQAVGHNVMLVDRNPESQAAGDYENGIAALRDYPRMTRHFAGDIADEAEGDLTCVYKGAVSAYTRSLLYMKPGVVFLFDRLKSDRGHEYGWLFHAEHTNGKSSIAYSGSTMTITRPQASLTMDVLYPEIVSHSITNSDRDESFITLMSAPGVTETSFLAVLATSSSGTPEKTKSELLEGDDWIGGRVETHGETTMAFFRNDGSAGTLVPEGFEAEANRFAITTDRAGQIKKLLLVQGTRFSRGGKQPFTLTATLPATVAMERESAGTTFEADTSGETDIVISMPRAPEKVLSILDRGNQIGSWSYDKEAKTVTVRLTEGRTKFMVYGL
ncbi:heparinase II/III family protein [bacterium]|nr:heparinase II/III family protein [bacterium]